MIQIREGRIREVTIKKYEFPNYKIFILNKFEKIFKMFGSRGDNLWKGNITVVKYTGKYIIIR